MINHYDEMIWEASLVALQGILANPNEHPEFRNPKETCEEANARLAVEQGERLVEAFVKAVKPSGSLRSRLVRSLRQPRQPSQ